MTAISKRTFLKFAAAGAAAVPASPLLAADAKAEPKTHWDTETDVLVIGYGGAGGAAAITAHDAGAKVLVIEKMKDGGGNTRASGGGFIIPKNADEAYQYLEKTFLFADNEMDGALVRTFCERAVKLPELSGSRRRPSSASRGTRIIPICRLRRTSRSTASAAISQAGSSSSRFSGPRWRQTGRSRCGSEARRRN